MFFVLNNLEITSRSSESDYRQPPRVATKTYSNTFKSLPKVTQVDKAALSGVQVDYNLEAYYIYDLAKYLNAQ